MTWTRLSDDFPDRPELLEVSRDARLLHIEALVYCNRHTTDGRVPQAAIPRFSDSPDPDAGIEELIQAGVWERLHPGALQILGWVDREHQEAADDVRAREERNRAKQQAYRDRKSRHAAQDHTRCDPRYCSGRRKHDADDHSQCQDGLCVTGNATGNETVSVTSGVTPSPPGPALPGPKGQGQGQGTAPAGRRCPHNWPVDADGDTGCATCLAERQQPDPDAVVSAPPVAAVIERIREGHAS